MRVAGVSIFVHCAHIKIKGIGSVPKTKASAARISHCFLRRQARQGRIFTVAGCNSHKVVTLSLPLANHIG